jgi:hypothetical protein
MKDYTNTKGNVIVENIKIGDIHYEYEYGIFLKVEVVSLPQKNGDQWTWKSKKLNDGRIIDYLVTKGLSYYGPNLYDYRAYDGCEEI